MKNKWCLKSLIRWFISAPVVPLCATLVVSCNQASGDKNDPNLSSKVKWESPTFLVQDDGTNINQSVLFSLKLKAGQNWLVPEAIRFDLKNWKIFDFNQQEISPFQTIIEGFDSEPFSLEHPNGWLWNATVGQLQFKMRFNLQIETIKTVIWESPISDELINFQKLEKIY